MKLKLLKTLPLLLLMISVSINAQKIKGSKNVTTEKRDIDNYTTLEIQDDFNVYLSEGKSQELKVETDDNIQDFVEIKTKNNTLSIYLTKEISRKKKLNIYITSTENLNTINTFDKSNLYADSQLQLDSLVINTSDRSKVEMDIKSNYLQINGSDNSNLKMTISSDSIVDVRLENSSKLKANITTKELTFTGSNNSVLIAEGTTTFIEINTVDDSTFEGHAFISDEATISSDGTSDVYINAKETLTISAKDKSEVYIFENPEITLEQFSDKAILRKKEKMSLIRL
jgi:hypothetical protein